MNKKAVWPVAELEYFLKVDAALVDTVDDVLVDPVQDQRNYAHHGRLQHAGITLLSTLHLKKVYLNM